MHEKQITTIRGSTVLVKLQEFVVKECVNMNILIQTHMSIIIILISVGIQQGLARTSTFF